MSFLLAYTSLKSFISARYCLIVVYPPYVKANIINLNQKPLNSVWSTHYYNSIVRVVCKSTKHWQIFISNIKKLFEWNWGHLVGFLIDVVDMRRISYGWINEWCKFEWKSKWRNAICRMDEIQNDLILVHIFSSFNNVTPI